MICIKDLEHCINLTPESNFVSVITVLTEKASLTWAEKRAWKRQHTPRWMGERTLYSGIFKQPVIVGYISVLLIFLCFCMFAFLHYLTFFFSLALSSLFPFNKGKVKIPLVSKILNKPLVFRQFTVKIFNWWKNRHLERILFSSNFLWATQQRTWRVIHSKKILVCPYRMHW